MKVVKWRGAQNLAIPNCVKRSMVDPTKCHILALGDCKEGKEVTRGAAWRFVCYVSSREGKLALAGGAR